MDTQEHIRKQVTENKVVLYMKGTPEAPQCGFSAAAVQMLEACGVEEVATVNVLADPDIRQGIKEFSNWPTIPQLYVNGEFVGGSDIMREMYQSGELQKLLTSNGDSVPQGLASLPALFRLSRGPAYEDVRRSAKVTRSE